MIKLTFPEPGATLIAAGILTSAPLNIRPPLSWLGKRVEITPDWKLALDHWQVLWKQVWPQHTKQKYGLYHLVAENRRRHDDDEDIGTATVIEITRVREPERSPMGLVFYDEYRRQEIYRTPGQVRGHDLRHFLETKEKPFWMLSFDKAQPSDKMKDIALAHMPLAMMNGTSWAR